MVAKTFIPNFKNKKEVNHINGIKTDNRVKNLEWCTRSENQKHRYKLFGHKGPNKGKLGKYNHLSKKVAQYDLDNNLIKIWDSMIDIERNLNIKSSNISCVCRNKKYCYAAGGFKWKYL